MHTGRGQLLSVGDTVVSEHMATLDHDSGDIEIKLLGFERSWKKRVIKERIAINKLKPNLNGTEGHHISAIFDSLPSALARGARSNSSDDVMSASNHIEAILWKAPQQTESTDDESGSALEIYLEF